jgi:hypothetical protein
MSVEERRKRLGVELGGRLNWSRNPRHGNHSASDSINGIREGWSCLPLVDAIEAAYFIVHGGDSADQDASETRTDSAARLDKELAGRLSTDNRRSMIHDLTYASGHHAWRCIPNDDATGAAFVVANLRPSSDTEPDADAITHGS